MFDIERIVDIKWDQEKKENLNLIFDDGYIVTLVEEDVVKLINFLLTN